MCTSSISSPTASIMYDAPPKNSIVISKIQLLSIHNSSPDRALGRWHISSNVLFTYALASWILASHIIAERCKHTYHRGRPDPTIPSGLQWLDDQQIRWQHKRLPTLPKIRCVIGAGYELLRINVLAFFSPRHTSWLVPKRWIHLILAPELDRQ